MSRLGSALVVGIIALMAMAAPGRSQTDAVSPELLHSIEMMEAAQTQALAIAKLTDLDEVQMIKMEELVSKEADPIIAADSIERAIARHAAEITSLRDAIEQNRLVQEALAKEGVDVSDVVAAELRENDRLTIYLRKQ